MYVGVLPDPLRTVIDMILMFATESDEYSSQSQDASNDRKQVTIA